MGQAWQINSASQTAIAALGNVAVANNSIAATLHSQSITLFVIPPGTVTSPPAAPTGLAATVGSGTVRLTWFATGGATSYSVKRATVSGGPYSTIATVNSPSPTSFTDTGLTNATTYYYVVSGTNAAGTSPNSAELSAVPIVPPKFSTSAAASPNPVPQGATTTIQVQVTCTAQTLTNGTIQVLVTDPNGAAALLQNYTGQNFATNQSRSYTLTLTPARAGNYTVQIGVFSATWQLWNWNSSAATITVTSPLIFTASATASPSTIPVGGTSIISATVTETGSGTLANSNVELQIFSQSGTAVATTYWSGQNFNIGQSHSYSYSWTPGSAVPPGTYSVDIGVFDAAWATNYYWNGSAATITVTP